MMSGFIGRPARVTDWDSLCRVPRNVKTTGVKILAVENRILSHFYFYGGPQ